MDSIRTFLRKYYGFVFLAAFVGFFLILFQSLYLMNADDRVYSTIANASFGDVLYFMRYHYGYCNGRTWIHMVLLLLLRFGVYPWRIFMPLWFGAICVLAARLFSDDAPSFQKALALTCVSFLTVGAAVYDQALFWETGSMNYIFPVFFILLLFLLLKKHKCLWLVPILGLLCGASTEQFGMITFGGLVLWAAVKVIRKEPFPRILTAVTAVCVAAGLLSVVLSPSVQARTYEASSSIYDRFSMLAFGMWFHSLDMLPLLLFLTVAFTLYLYSAAPPHDRRYRPAALLLAAAVGGSFGISFLHIPILSSLCVYASAALFLVGAFAAAIHALRVQKKAVPLIMLLLGGGAQVMMLVTQRIAIRVTMPSVFCFLLFALSLLLSCGETLPRALKACAAVLTAALIVWNICGYCGVARTHKSEFLAGERTANHIHSHQSREDVDRIIDEIEQVRLTEIAKHKQGS